MKNFKKVLALVLVVVMALSVVTISSAAFTDAASITKAEAVDVLAAIGVINGYTDGSYKPEGNVTRAEMAKMIATIKNEGEDVGALYAGACTFADSASHWAAGYIAYCAQEGIINGKNASTFDPDANVTGTEAAKMVLGALGHKADAAGLTGGSWASTTMSLARKYALVGADNNLTANMGEALNRENAAQLLFNGLQATTVTYSGGTTFKLPDGTTVVTGATMTEDNTSMMSVYFPTLGTTNKTTDEFGRTVRTWEFGAPAEEIGSYSVAPYMTYTGEVTMGQLYTDLGKVAGSQLASVTYFADGATKFTQQYTAANFKTALASGNTTDVIGGVGVTTEIYFDEENLTLNVVEINTYVGRVGTVVAAKKDANGDITKEGYVVIKDFAGTSNAVNGAATLLDGTTVTSGFITDAFTTADQTAKTVVYFTKGVVNGQAVIMSVAPATVVTGTNKGTAAVNGTVVDVTIDGTTYQAQAAASVNAGTYGEAETLYLDGNGYIIANEAVVSNNYAFALEGWTVGGYQSTLNAALLFADGTVKEDIVVETNTTVQGALTTENAIDSATIVKYTVTAEGKYILTNATVGTATQVITGTPSLGQNKLNADKNTVFVFGDVNNGVATYTVYTGIANVPTLQNINSDVYYVQSNTSANAGLVFCLDIDPTTAATEKFGMLYIAGTEKTNTGANGTSYAEVTAVIDGAVTEVLVDGTYFQTLSQSTGIYLFKDTTVDPTTGYYTNFTAATNESNVTAVVANQFAEYADGLITVATGTTVYVEADTTVFVYNTDAKKVEKTTIAEITTDMVANGVTGGYMTYELNSNGSNGAVNGLYLVVKA